jgi:C4-type Zn-finger protein
MTECVAHLTAIGATAVTICGLLFKIYNSLKGHVQVNQEVSNDQAKKMDEFLQAVQEIIKKK